MKLIPLLSLAILLSPPAFAADKTILEVQRDIALLQDQVHSLEQRITALQTSVQQLAQQNTDNAAKADARMDKLQTAVAEAVKGELEKLTVPLSGVTTKLDGMSADVSQLRDASTETNRQITTLRSQMDDMNNVVKALQSPAAAPPENQSPVEATKLFTDATGDMSGKQDFALKEFNNFLHMFPTDPQAPHAQFNIGQIHYGQGHFDQAAQDFDTVITQFPGSQYEADAMYMKGLSLLKVGQKLAAYEVFKALVAKYPQSSQAAQARDQLRTLPAKR